MGYQINYYLMPEDMRLLEKRLREACPLLVLDWQSPSGAPIPLSNLEVARFGETRLGVVLVQPEALGDVHLRYVPRQGYWTVESDSPVIELSRCFYDGEILRRGRLYYQRQFVEEGAWVEKPESFQAWARRIFSVTRRTLQKLPDSPYYIGPRALAEYQQGRVKLVT